MHFLVSPIGSAGDVHPFLGLALALRGRGHEITFVVNGYFKDLVERFDLDYVEFGTAQEFLDAANNPDLWDPVKGFQHIFKSLVELALRQQYEILAEHYQPGRSVALASCLGFGARVARDKLGIPLATLNLQPSVIWSNVEPPIVAGMFGPRWLRNLEFAIGERFFIDPVVCPGLNAFRAELDLPPVRRMVRSWHSPDALVCMFPKWFAAPQPDWPPNVIQTDFPLWDQETSETLPAEVHAYLAQGHPPVVFTPGSANLFGAAFFRSAVDACARLGRRGILLTRFDEQVPADLPPGIVHYPYLPFSQLLPRVAAVVHHGGVGSTAQGLAAGVPQLIMPLAHDQFDNAERVRRLGVGDWLYQAKFTGPRVARKLEALLTSVAVPNACRGVAARLTRHDGCPQTALALEQWADRMVRRPMPAALRR